MSAAVPHPRYIVPAHRPQPLAEQDARPIEGILTAVGLGLLFWAAVGLAAGLS